MPAFYTHAKFGKQVLAQLEPELRDEINKYPDLFFIGLQGPDILFYYKGYKKNHVARTGYEQHDKAGELFFGPALETARKSFNREASFSYLAGFICHFTLDSQCHPYIETVELSKGLSHTEIECEEDRYLMIKDGEDYLRHLESDQVVNSKENARVIAQFFPTISAKEVKAALWYLKVISRLFRAPGKVKRTFVTKGLKLIGQEKLSGMIVNYEENSECHESTLHIEALAEEAVSIACLLIREYQESIKKEGTPLHSRYQKTFGA